MWAALRSAGIRAVAAAAGDAGRGEGWGCGRTGCGVTGRAVGAAGRALESDGSGCPDPARFHPALPVLLFV